MAKEKILSITKKDFDIQTFCSGGPGGQHQNKTDSGVRLIHRASGAVGESRSERSQYQNKRIALKRLIETTKFKIWLNKVVYESAQTKSVEQRVEEAMSSDKIKIEVKNEQGRWEEPNEELTI